MHVFRIRRIASIPVLVMALLVTLSCQFVGMKGSSTSALGAENSSSTYQPSPSNIAISKESYADQLHGFWLGQSIGNWTGLITEMVKIGNIGEMKTGDFYTRVDWGGPAEPAIWSETPVDFSPTIDFVFVEEGGTWGADDDTDIEYIYQHLLYNHKTSILTPEQIRDGWLTHIYSDRKKTPYGDDPDRPGYFQNYLWVSNQRAYNLMEEGMLPPETGKPENNEHYDMIDAQLTTEIFGLFAPARPDVALRMAHLPIRTSASEEAAWIAEFYVIMHSLASAQSDEKALNDRVMWMAGEARKHLPRGSYAAKMYDFVLSRYQADVPWEQVRDEIYQRYQVEQKDGYDITSRNLYCNGCFAAGINYASSLVSLFWGGGDIKETIKIAVLAGWDSDNPAATWGGLLGFMIGKSGVEEAFGRELSNQFNIHRTRRNFPNDGVDTLENMARVGVAIVDRVVQEEMGGSTDRAGQLWHIPVRN